MCLKISLLLLLLVQASDTFSQVYITEVDPGTDRVELTNIGNDVINMLDVSVWDGVHTMILARSIPTECGDFIMTPGEITVFTTDFDIPVAGGTIWLQDATVAPIRRIQFMQWGGIQSLSNLAMSEGLWDDFRDFIPAPANGESIELVDEGNITNSRGFLLQANPSLCRSNTACRIDVVRLRVLDCDDNNTPEDATDDFFRFSLFVDGVNLRGDAELRLDGGMLTPTTYPVDCTDCTFTTSPGTATGEDYQLTITTNEGACDTTLLLTSPAPCSPVCQIVYHQIINQVCHDNNTLSNPEDDYFEFIFRAWGFNLSEDGYVLVFPDGQVLGPYAYDVGAMVSTQGIINAGTGPFDVIVRDIDNADCVKVVEFPDLGTCSVQCGFSSSTISNVSCNDNGTDADPSDDYLSFDVMVEGNNLSDRYWIRSPQTSFEPAIGSSLTVSRFRTAPGVDNLDNITISIHDEEDDDCSINDVLVNPGACSDNCWLSIDSLSIACNNGGTNNDRADDFFELWLEVDGVNTSAFYTASILPFAEEVLTLQYDSLYYFATPAGSAIEVDVFAFTFLDKEKPCTGVTLSGMFDYDCITTAVLDEIDNDQVTLFPNPVSQTLQVAWSGIQPPEQVRVDIRDVQGRLWYSALLINNEVELRHLTGGMYVVEVYTDHWISRQRIMKM